MWNEMHSSAAVRMAVGSVIELAFRVAAGELKVRLSPTLMSVSSCCVGVPSLCACFSRMASQLFVLQGTMLRSPRLCQYTCHSILTTFLSDYISSLNNMFFLMCLHRGFCFFNSVAITAKLLQQKLGVGKILIVDWVRGQIYTQSCFHIFVGTSN